MMRWHRVLIVVAAAALLVAAGAMPAHAGAPGRKPGTAGKPRKGPKTHPGEEIAHEGTIAVVRGVRGAEPQLTERDGARWLLVGDLQPELLRLGGHTVKVWAFVGDKQPVLPTLSVRRYEILDSGAGRKPFVGSLRESARKELQLQLPDDTVLTVQAKKPLLAQLRRKLGCKVWLAGELEGDTLNAHKYGWLSCAKQRPLKAQKETSK